jgi:hypothetical protein
VPTATVQRNDSASAPGTAPYGSWSWLVRTIERCWPMSAPRLSGSVRSGVIAGHSPLTAPVLQAA